MAIMHSLKRTSLVLACIVAAISFLPPAFAVNGNFYRYSVRHEKGAPFYFPYWAVDHESVNSANGNLFFTIPLVSRPGRNGLGVNLNLAYNSKFWEHTDSYATLAERDSWVGPGWTLLVARVIDDSVNGHYYVTLSDGSNHDITWYGGAWRSSDSTYMVYDPAARRLTLKGGANYLCGYVDPLDSTIRYATRVQDTNGNYLDIAYSGTGGRISSIQDTLGSTYTFLLNANNRLNYIKFWNTNDTTQATSTITMTYQSQTLAFGIEETTDPTLPAQYLPSQVIYPTGLRYQFTYGTSGEIADITYPSGGHSRYFYTTERPLDRLRGLSVYEHMVSSHDKGAGTPGTTWFYNGSSCGGCRLTIEAAPWFTKITLPYPANTEIVHYMQMNTGPAWADGFLRVTAETVLYSLSTETDLGWTQDDEFLTTILNPRITYSTKVMVGSPNKTVRTEFSYAPIGDYSGNIKEKRELAFSGSVMRKTILNYLHEANGVYVPLNIIDRVTETYVYDGNDALIAKTVATYDNFVGGIYSAPGAIRHDPGFGTAWRTRGLPTMVTRWYDLVNNYTVAPSIGYDECGNPRTVTDGRNYSTSMVYWLTAADNAYAFPLQTSNPKGHLTQATYSYNSGLMLSRTDPNNKVTSMQYDSWDRVTRITRPSGGITTYTYTDSTPPGPPPSAQISDKVDSADHYRTRSAQLDNMGRLAESTFVDPAGDVKKAVTYNSLDQMQYADYPHRSGQPAYQDEYTYRGVSFLSRIQHQDVGTISFSYDTNKKTVTNTDGRRRRYTYQEDGKISEVLEEDLGPNPQLTIPTTYAYDALGRLTTISQGVQTRTFTYDALGRQLSETHPESGTTAYTYDANSNVLTRTDARGIVTTSAYDELNRITSKTFSDGTAGVTFTYDVQPVGSPITISNPIGRLTKVATTTSGVTASHYYSYCNCSSVDRESTVISGDGSPALTRPVTSTTTSAN